MAKELGIDKAISPSMTEKGDSNVQNPKKNHEAQMSKFSFLFLTYSYIRNFTDRIYIRVCKILKDRVTSFSQFILGKAKKIFLKSQPQFQEKLRKFMCRQSSFLM